ncbi:T9SS type A sorting domain-containing protein [Pontibacter sp. G13]|uniref:T9SS type A sorting domain-containing protein n=1 Tax=Pontibacter sp. G13 TaxID=3074898 RepID=UPI0028895D55|nr:T9SS type A sorting domain-containing protein [Pontibacter sp. G13]WNJ20866.1 T9SS type A sorting domain-containing protein [Pontibacter sp. G13]
MKFFVLILLSFFCFPVFVFSQCASPLPIGDCSGGNGEASNGQNINSGQTFWFAGNATFPAGVNLNGGTLRVCGTLILSTISFNSGTIIVEEAGSLTINGSSTLNFNGNKTVSNRGQLTINRSITMQNQNNLIINAATGIFEMTGGNYTLEINSATSNFVNSNLATIDNLFIQGSTSPGAVCLGFGSQLIIPGDLNNNQAGGKDAPEGTGCVQYFGNAQLNADLATTSNVFVCRAPGSTTSGGAGFGSATVQENCTTCQTSLPIEMAAFEASQQGTRNRITWITSREINNDRFEIERAQIAGGWDAIGTVAGAGTSNEGQHYTFWDATPAPGTNFYRLKQIDLDGSTTYSPIVSVEQSPARSKQLEVFPNPATDKAWVQLSAGSSQTVEILNVSGGRLSQQLQSSTTSSELIQLDLSQLPSGIYVIRHGNQVQKLIKL